MKIKKTCLSASVAAWALLSWSQCMAFDSVSLEYGGGDETRMTRVGVQSTWDSQWWKSNGTHIGGYWDLSYAHWKSSGRNEHPGVRQSVNVIGLTPVFRYQSDSMKGFYAEAGIGANLLTHLYTDGERRLSTRFQFGDHIGLGYVFNNNMDVALKIQHFSNAGIKKPNPGVDFAVLTLRYKF